MILRPYQDDMVACAVAAFKAKKTVLIQAATGAGKTIVFADLIRRFLNDYPHLRILVLVHREIIVKQNADKLRRIWPQAPIGIACASASSHVDMHSPVVFGSVQTLASRIETMPSFHLVIVDEAHRLPPKSSETQYKKVINRLLSFYPSMRLFGLTATPFRLGWGPIYGKKHKRLSDDKPSENWFDDLDMAIGIKQLQAIQPDDQNPDAPYLCGMRAFVEDKSISVELKGISKTAGEFNQAELSDLMRKTIHLQTALTSYQKHREGRIRCVIFAVDIDHAERLTQIFTACGIGCECVHSEKAKEHNRDVLTRFDAGSVPVVVNVGVLCLDEQTEILTSEGWIGIDCMTMTHKVANWDQGSIIFHEPLEIIRRQRLPGEKMVVLSGNRLNARVTEGHGILYRTARNGLFLKKPARELISKRLRLPVSGMAEPFQLVAEQQPIITEKRRKLLKTKSRYNLRKLEGYSNEDSIQEAEKRVDHKYGMKRKNPSELTLDECELIGFWVGDGSKSNLQSGGMEYGFSQSIVYPKIIEWFDNLINRTGIHYIKRRQEKGNNRPNATIHWSLSRGTGGGAQQREGVFPIEQYLDKNGSRLLWGLNSDQFDSFIHGYWMADGNHYDGFSKPIKHQFVISGVNRKLFDLLQAIAVTRGYRSSISTEKYPRKSYYKPLLRLGLNKTFQYSMGNDLFSFEPLPWKPERVWCVRTDTKNIITRRGGRVLVMGNSEGWDCRSVDLLILCRPTMSASLFVQIVGRGLRTFPGKQDVLILDLAGNFNRHGPPWEPILPDYSRPGRPMEKKVIPDKKCPACGHENPAGCWCCEECGEILRVKQVEEAKAVKLRELNLDRMGQPDPGQKGRVVSMEFGRHVTARGDACLKVSLFVELEKDELRQSLYSGGIGLNATHFFRLDGPGAWYFGRAWKKIAPGMPLPGSVEEAVKMKSKIGILPNVMVKKEGKYWKVQGW